MGTLQATETIKLVLGRGEVTRAGVDRCAGSSTFEFRESLDPHCVICGNAPTITDLVDYDAFCGGGAAADSLVPQLAPL